MYWKKVMTVVPGKLGGRGGEKTDIRKLRWITGKLGYRGKKFISNRGH